MENIIYEFSTVLDNNFHPVLRKIRRFRVKEESFTTADAVVKLLNRCFNLKKLAEEHVIILGMTSSCKVLGMFQLSHGTVNQSYVQTRELFQKLLLCGAANFIIAHNHPGGSLVPTPADKQLATKLQEASQLMAIPMIDNIIVSKTGYFSFQQNGML